MCKYYTRILAAVAIIVGILSLVLPMDKAAAIVAIENFFGVMLPILAVGALFKYIFSCTKAKDCDKDNGQCKK
ncbi:MAG: hypothetical protein KBD83_05155 [Gammaproteobacteria bacterium]|jgi:hypothetical protein|nr:hypothetical protein [Gammaproteobacteria bacterium]